MPPDPAHFLNELPIWKLKAIAAEYRIDVTACKYKKDYVNKIRSKKLTDEQVRKALAKVRNAEAERPAEEIRAIVKDLEDIASRPLEPTELPSGEEKTVERSIDEALTMRPSFFEIDSSMESAMNRMLIGDFHEAIRINREARLRCLDTFSGFQVYSSAVAIRAVDELLARLPESMFKMDPALKTAQAAAKRAFLSGTPRQREETLENLEALAIKTYETFVKDTEVHETELKELLADYESFGTRTEEPRRYLEIAASAKQTFNVEEYSRYIEEAKNRAERSKQDRVREIENIFDLVKASAAEAQELGGDVSATADALRNARKAYDNGSFRHAVELLASVERALDAHHVDIMKGRKELEATQLQKASFWIAQYEPVLTEASGYGFDVSDAQAKLSVAKAALSKRDPVNAPKYGRYVHEAVKKIDKDLDNKRLELGIVKHVEGSKCQECGQESLYEHPNATRKCFSCGSITSMAMPSPPAPAFQPVQPQQVPAAQTPVPGPQKPPEPKKRRLLRW